MKNYRVSQTFCLTGRITLSDNNEHTYLGEYHFLLKPLRDLILNGGNLEKGDELSISHQEGKYTMWSSIRIDKITYTINESGIVTGINLLIYAKYL